MAQSRISDDDTYYEVHHIIPKSLDGNDLSQNLVKVTAREHFICHLLLTKMTYGKHKRNMYFALWAMSNKMKHTRNTNAFNFTVYSRFYQTAKENFALENSKTHAGKKLSQSTKDKISKAHIGKKLSEEHKSKINPAGRKHSEESKDKISKNQIGRVGGMAGKTHSEETKNKISAGNMGKTMPSLSIERKQQISKQFSGITQSEEHISKRIISREENGHYRDRNKTVIKMRESAKNRPTLTCECGTVCSPANFSRWHGGNCKHLKC